MIGNRTSINGVSGSITTTPTADPPLTHGEMAPGKAEHKAMVEGIHSRAVTENLPSQVVNGVIWRGVMLQ